MKLTPEFFQRDDTLAIGRELLGKYLVSTCGGVITSGMIVETEAYHGELDRACHSFGRRRTARNEVMYLPGGHWYVYMCYGIHALLNVVTHAVDEPHGVLIRAIEPCEGIDHMLKRRKMDKIQTKLTSGPGCITDALGITRGLSGQKVGGEVWIEDRGILVSDSQIFASPRIGVLYAGEDALLPYRFEIKGNKWVSAPRAPN